MSLRPPLLVAFVVLVLAANVSQTNAQQVYWTETGFGDGRIRRANLDGSGLTTLAGDSTAMPEGLALDAAGNVYWTELRFSDAEVLRSGPSFGALSIRAQHGSALRGIAIDQKNDRIFWSASNLQSGARIFSEKFSSTQVDSFLAIGPSSNPRGLAIDTAGGFLYWAEYDQGKIRRASLDTPRTVQDVASGLKGPVGLALDPKSATLYWSESGNNLIRKSQLDGSGAVTVLSGLGIPGYVALDLAGRRIMWSELSPPRIGYAGMDGSSPKYMPVSATLPGGIAVSSTLTDVTNATSQTPTQFRLDQNYPNPFNATSRIRFTVAKAGEATLEVLDLLGRVVTVPFRGNAEPGREYDVRLDGTRLSSGVYLYRLKSAGSSLVRRAVMIK